MNTRQVFRGAQFWQERRVQPRWAGVHSDEVYFRDTAHGLTSWAIATLAAAVLLTSTVAAVMGSGVRAGSEVSASLIEGAAEAISSTGSASASYFTDALLRTDQSTNSPAISDAVRAEMSTLFLRSLLQDELVTNDSQYMASVISRYTGISQRDAELRIADIRDQAQQAALDFETAAREAADTARRSASHSALWMFVALLCGAFFASLMATLGGRQRDSVVYDTVQLTTLRSD